MIFAPLVSGSSGNCTYVEAGDVRLLIDAGPSARRICGLLREISVEPSSIGAILITHEHTDHIGGVAVFSK
ncbi:MAG: MBL fold metallo-hydrolase, partial [Clostridiales bacterium]|nr:MBL fold metallo-hydrolase [Clostridiales bacterium]